MNKRTLALKFAEDSCDTRHPESYYVQDFPYEKMVVIRDVLRTVGQSRKMSFVESLVNVAVGLIIALIAQHFVFPAFGVHISFAANLGIAGIMTIVSIARSYALRRGFNWWHGR